MVSILAASTSPGIFLKITNVQASPWPTESKTLGMSTTTCFPKPSGWFHCTLKCENHCSILTLDLSQKATVPMCPKKSLPHLLRELSFLSCSSSFLILLNAGSFPSLEELTSVSPIIWKEPPPPTPTLSQHRIFTLSLKRKINKYRKPKSKLQTNHKKHLVCVWTICE